MLRTQQIYVPLDSAPIQSLVDADPRFGALALRLGPLVYDLYLDDYPFLIAQIVAQMLSDVAAAKIFARLETLCDNNLAPEIFDELDDSDLKHVGLSRPKISYIRNINDEIREGSLDLHALRLLDDEQAFNAFHSIRGIGPWTATMMLLCVHNRDNILNRFDRCFMHVYQWLYPNTPLTPKTIQQHAKRWTPYASFVARYFYLAHERKLTHTPTPTIYEDCDE